MDDQEFLGWVYGRLVNVHGESEEMEYMKRLQRIAREGVLILGGSESVVEKPKEFDPAEAVATLKALHKASVAYEEELADEFADQVKSRPVDKNGRPLEYKDGEKFERVVIGKKPTGRGRVYLTNEKGERIAETRFVDGGWTAALKEALNENKDQSGGLWAVSHAELVEAAGAKGGK